MRINVRLFGTLREHFADYHPDRGIHLEIPEGTKASDLTSLLGISQTQGITFLTEGRIMAADEKLVAGSAISILQMMSGG